MIEDPRCCGSGACLINEEGYCWCGQKWDGGKMCFPLLENATQDGKDDNVPQIKRATHA